MILLTTLLAVLYGFAWHDEPAKERYLEERSRR
jgi:hypothetical protein